MGTMRSVFNLPSGTLQRPLIGAGNVETVEGEIDGFADAHAGVTEQQEEVGPQIVAAVQFLLEQLIVFRRQGARGLRERRGISCRRSNWPNSGNCAVQANSARTPRRKMSRRM